MMVARVRACVNVCDLLLLFGVLLRRRAAAAFVAAIVAAAAAAAFFLSLFLSFSLSCLGICLDMFVMTFNKCFRAHMGSGVWAETDLFKLPTTNK